MGVSLCLGLECWHQLCPTCDWGGSVNNTSPKSSACVDVGVCLCCDGNDPKPHKYNPPVCAALLLIPLNSSTFCRWLQQQLQQHTALVVVPTHTATATGLTSRPQHTQPRRAALSSSSSSVRSARSAQPQQQQQQVAIQQVPTTSQQQQQTAAAHNARSAGVEGRSSG